LKLALFDLDNTLLSGDSDFEWAQFLISQGVFDREVYEARNKEFYDQYRRGVLDIDEFLDFQLKPLSRHPRKQLDAWHSEFMQRHIVPLIGIKARALLEQHREHTRVVVTATNSFVTRPIVEALGVELLIATEAEQIDGEFTGKVSGVPAFREGKVTRVQHWLAQQKLSLGVLEQSWFYSDSLNDLPLLSLVTNPVAVDPDDTLRAHAEQHGWPILSLRVF
jgi:HAD superfamily hydrolase (TIGR01490 family)